MKPIISIIIPFYNSIHTLERCVISILNQSFKDYEIILVNDGSDDGSEKVARKYAEEYENILLFESEKRGVSSARNVGLKAMRGDYCCFIDADDFVDCDYLLSLYELVVETKTLVGTCGYSRDIQKKSFKKGEKITIKKEDYDLFSEYARGTVWAAIFSKEIVENVYFDEELSVGEDTLFFMTVLMKCDKVSFVGDVLYYYVFSKDSLSQRRWTAKKMDNIYAWQKICDMAKNENIRFFNACKMKLVGCCKRSIREIAKTTIDVEEREIQYIIGIISQNKDTIRNSHISRLKKWEYVCIVSNPNMYMRIYRIMSK